MKLKDLNTIIPALVLVVGVAALALSMTVRAPSVAASDARNGQLHLVKDCTSYNGLAGATCTIKSSNLAEIPMGSTVHYGQAISILHSGWLDSNVVLDAGNGNKAAGRCTVDFTITTPGVCTFSDGTGHFAGFKARLNVTTSPTPPADYALDGTYSFNPLPPR
jgi:hypothetical protein